MRGQIRGHSLFSQFDELSILLASLPQFILDSRLKIFDEWNFM